jgi:exodeoxyribonuclease V alpha subunit
MPPHTREGIERFLASGMIKGVGPEYAKRIVAAFGERTLQIIDQSPSFLSEVKGIGTKRLALIRQSWCEQKAVRDIMVFLQAHGMGPARALRIHRTYGDDAVAKIRANPYRLAADIWGIGFQIADDLAGKLGIAPDSPERARAALRHALREFSTDGHVGYPEEGVVERMVAMTGIAPELAQKAVETERLDGAVVRDTRMTPPWLYLKSLYLAETHLATHLAELGKGAPPLGTVSDSALMAIQTRMALELAPEQKEALRMAGTSRVLIITGGPGVGKTTIVRGIVELYRQKNRKIELCAPTGRAAKRLNETTGLEARTLHRLLEFDPGRGSFTRDGSNPLEGDLFLVDEASMLDVNLAWGFVRAIPKGASLVLVGDVDQLPSVGPGRVLAELIGSGCLPVARLTRVFRQAARSGIVRAAHAVREGQLPDLEVPADDFFFVASEDPADIAEKLELLVRERIPKKFGLDPMRDIQVLTPMNRTELGVTALNGRLQAALNPDRGQIAVERFGQKFRVGDRVLQTHNNYKKQIYNGDLGVIVAIDEINRELTVRFDGRDVPFDLGELDEISLAYALSIHKSQGSEYPAVVMPLHTQHFMMLQRNLLYTGLTRARKLAVIVGSLRALKLAVDRQDTRERHTALGDRMREALNRAESVSGNPDDSFDP